MTDHGIPLSRAPGIEFSRVVTVSTLPPRAVTVDLAVSEEERAALAARLGLVSVDALRATVTLTPAAVAGDVRVHGSLTAHVEQTCVVSLEPLCRTYVETFDSVFSPHIDAMDDHEPGAMDEDTFIEPQDLPEPLDGDSIDIGEVVAQFLSLALDPYPRDEGAELEPNVRQINQDPSEGDTGPFAALAALKQKL